MVNEPETLSIGIEEYVNIDILADRLAKRKIQCTNGAEISALKQEPFY